MARLQVMIGARDQLKANQDVTQQVRVVDKFGKNKAVKDLRRPPEVPRRLG